MIFFPSTHWMVIRTCPNRHQPPPSGGEENTAPDAMGRKKTDLPDAGLLDIVYPASVPKIGLPLHWKCRVAESAMDLMGERGRFLCCEGRQDGVAVYRGIPPRRALQTALPQGKGGLPQRRKTLRALEIKQPRSTSGPIATGSTIESVKRDAGRRRPGALPKIAN